MIAAAFLPLCFLIQTSHSPELWPDNQKKRVGVRLNFLCPEGQHGVMGKSWVLELDATRFQ